MVFTVVVQCWMRPKYWTCLLIHECVCLISKPICLMMMMMMMMHYVTEFVLMPLCIFSLLFSFDPLALPWCVSICLNLYIHSRVYVLWCFQAKPCRCWVLSLQFSTSKCPQPLQATVLDFPSRPTDLFVPASLSGRHPEMTPEMDQGPQSNRPYQTICHGNDKGS